MALVPALKRGISVLQICEQHGHLSLEQLAGLTGIPKASALRLCETLIHLDLLRRDPDSKRFHACARIIPLSGGGGDFLAQLRVSVAKLAQETAQTVEWYIPHADGMVIAERAEPETTVVRVVAKIGYLRTWESELEAVITVARAFGEKQPVPTTSGWVWDENGKQRTLLPDAFEQRIATCRANGYCLDASFNSNGVRRMAVPVFRGEGLVGILAVAMSFSPGVSARLREYEVAMRREAVALSGMES